ncbi:GTPase [Planctomicrobium sp. SH661]|uniref:GTPase n=1 Tax=Planctomicrobium sp. SH661 TaxID=3448124 RepID=UPI003F5B4A94
MSIPGFSSSSVKLTACLLTPVGRGAVATIGFRGDLSLLDGLFRAASQKELSQLSLNRVNFGHWGSESSEEVVLTKIADDAAELHCHGGQAAVERILQDVTAIGGSVADLSSWMKREHSPVEAECQIALMKATTLKTAHHLLRQVSLFPAAVKHLQTLPPEARREQIEALLRWSNFGEHLTTPWKVVLCGRPNVGKSSLINALVGYTRSVVFDQPGTTRDVVAVETAFDGWPVELSDTAGLRETTGELEAAGISLARERMREADLLLIIMDAATGVTEEDQELRKTFPDAIPVFNKCDLVPPTHADSLSTEAITVSAFKQTGIEKLIQTISQRLVPAEPPLTATYPVTETQRRHLEQWHAST